MELAAPHATVPDEPPKNYFAATVRGTFWNGLQFISSAATTLVLSVILTRFLDTSLYGIYTYVAWLSGVVILAANFGLSTTVIANVPKYLFSDRPDRASSIIRQVVKLQLLIVGLGLLVSIPLIGVWKHFTNFTFPNFPLLITLGFLTGLLGVFNALLTSIFAAQQRFKEYSLFGVAAILANFILLLSLLPFHPSIIVLLATSLTVNLILVVTLCFRQRSHLIGLRSVLREKLELSSIVHFSTWAYINVLLQAIIWERSEFFVLGKFHASSELAIYGIAYSLSVMLNSPVDPFLSTMTNIIAELVGKHDWNRVFLFIHKTSKGLLFLLLPIIISFAFVGPWLFTFVYGPSFTAAGHIVALLLFSAALNRVFSAAWSVPTLSGDLPKVVRLEIGVAALNIILDLALIPPYGVVGATIANCATQVAGLLILSWFVRRYRITIFNTEIFVVLAINVFLLAGLAGVAWWPAPAPAKVVAVLAVAVAYAAAGWRFVFPREDRRFVADFLDLLPSPVRFLRPLLAVARLFRS